ncbi:MAG: FtsW/RodA/SpoVE family cell cycle protein, partial [Alphaproteobacteria bacterium]
MDSRVKNRQTIGSLLYKMFFIRQDMALLSSILVIIAIGLVCQYTVSQADGDDWFTKQITTVSVLLVAMFVMTRINYTMLYDNAYMIYALGLMLLVIANVIGYKAMGAQRWIRIGFINFQPSEFMKIFLILGLARYYQDAHTDDIKGIRGHIVPLLLIVIPFLLILKQPNLGTASVILMLGVGIIFASGLNVKYFIGMGVIVLASGPVVWGLLHDYQKQRVLTFLNPELDPLGASYNIIQSMIAIGSGGLFGKGFLEGSQSKLSFLPEKHTDFIFSVLGEEFGFVGVMVTLSLVVLIILFSYRMALSSNT